MPKKLSKTVDSLVCARWLFYAAAGLMLIAIVAGLIFIPRPWNIFALCFIPLAFVVAVGHRILGLLAGVGHYSKELAEDEGVVAKRKEVDEYLRVNYPEEYAEEEAAESV